MVMKKKGLDLPRNGRYELFSTGGRTYCFDDPSWENYIHSNEEMFNWIRSQNPSLWEPMGDNPESNVALYLDPKLYVLWKLKWYYEKA
jgi:hypothetical protein